MAHATRRISLQPNELMNLDDARGTTIRVARGQVWITQYGDLADHVLVEGPLLRTRTGALTVKALHDCVHADRNKVQAATG